MYTDDKFDDRTRNPLEKAVHARAVKCDTLGVDDSEAPCFLAPDGCAMLKGRVTGERLAGVKGEGGHGDGLIVWSFRLDMTQVDLVRLASTSIHPKKQLV